MATEFSTLGEGNGFPFCLSRQTLTGSNIYIQNEPTLEETMAAYWNIDSIEFGGATWNPTNEPKDLICTPDANVGSDVNIISSSPQGIEYFEVILNRPRIIVYGGQEYLQHYIGMIYQNLYSGSYFANTSTFYGSTVYTDVSSPYECTPIYYKPSKGGTPVLVGHSASQTNQTITNVTISGIPFIKNQFQSWSGIDTNLPPPPCPSPAFLPNTSATPSITLHTY